MRVDVRRSERLTRGIAARTARSRRAPARAPPRRRALRPRQGARRRRRATCRSPSERSGPRRPGRRRATTWAIGNLQRALARLRRRRTSPTRSCSSTPRRCATRGVALLARARRRLRRPTSGGSWRPSEIMRLYRDGPRRARAPPAAAGPQGVAEEVLHPPSRTRAVRRPVRVAARARAGELAPLPAATGAAPACAIDRTWASSPSARPAPRLYRALRPEALAMLSSSARAPDAIARDRPARRDEHGARPPLPARCSRRNIEATRAFSLHTTGLAFDIAAHATARARRRSLPVHARPPDRAGPDRVGARAGGDPRHRRGARELGPPTALRTHRRDELDRGAGDGARGDPEPARAPPAPGRRRAEAVDRDRAVDPRSQPMADRRPRPRPTAGRAAAPRRGRPSSWAANSSQLGIDTTRAPMPSAASCSAAAIATADLRARPDDRDRSGPRRRAGRTRPGRRPRPTRRRAPAGPGARARAPPAPRGPRGSRATPRRSRCASPGPDARSGPGSRAAPRGARPAGASGRPRRGRPSRACRPTRPAARSARSGGSRRACSRRTAGTSSRTGRTIPPWAAMPLTDAAHAVLAHAEEHVAAARGRACSARRRRRGTRSSSTR